ncbi:MAG TPA: hypothetical protein VJ771_04065 [Candidatus Nitrosotalea sp.]|nr:hypothetical protein [Candidatus Nitrosotalea sp.]
MFIDWTVPLLIGVVGGPLAILVKFWYKKKDGSTSKFADNGTYVRDDSLYSYDSSKPSSTEGSSTDKNNS